MAEENSQPKGLAALLQTLDPERQEILLFLLEHDHRARLGAELVGPRAFSPKSTGEHTAGWTSGNWGDITLAEAPSGSSKKKEEQEILKRASEGLQWSEERPKIEALFATLYERPTPSALRSQYSLSLPPDERSGKDYRAAAKKLLYKDGILQPFVLFDRRNPHWFDPESKAPLLGEMTILAHELGHVADVWQTEHRADMDAEFSGKAGPSYFGIDDFLEYGHPRLVSMKETYKSGPGKYGNVVDEPYARLMDRYNRERLLEKGYQPYPSLEKEKLGYIPDRYQWSSWNIPDKERQDPFATKDYSTVESRDAAAHPAQGGALMELNRLLGRDPLEGMDSWLQRHGR